MSAIVVGTFRGSVDDIVALANLANEAKRFSSGICTFDFAQCKFLEPRSVAVLYAAKTTLNSRGIGTWATNVAPSIQVYLKGRGFFSNEMQFGEITVDAPLAQWRSFDGNSIETYLRDKWASSATWDNADYLDLVTGTIAEIFANAIQHGEHPQGVFCCGQQFPQKLLKLVVLDLGHTIPATVGRVTKLHPQEESDKAMEWAFVIGNSRFRRPRGTGLKILEEFVRTNRGSLEMFSGTGRTRADENGVVHGKHISGFPGTLVEVVVNTEMAIVPPVRWEY